jgi:hypothetical protein
VPSSGVSSRVYNLHILQCIKHTFTTYFKTVGSVCPPTTSRQHIENIPRQVCPQASAIQPARQMPSSRRGIGLRDKHMSTGRINKGTVTAVRVPTRRRRSPGEPSSSEHLHIHGLVGQPTLDRHHTWSAKLLPALSTLIRSK